MKSRPTSLVVIKLPKTNEASVKAKTNKPIPNSRASIGLFISTNAKERLPIEIICRKWVL